MKRRFYGSLAGILLTATLFSQETFKPELAVGASFGTTFSSVSFTPKVQQGMLMGYTAGVTARYNTEKNVGLQAELNYVQQGWKEQFD
ncbi:MAG: outer membrane beta-barrel protein, partial [Parabacteroides sp.]|nr:outer membrane beta-barrel protein [Parabacteroides sp.]